MEKKMSTFLLMKTFCLTRKLPLYSVMIKKNLMEFESHCLFRFKFDFKGQKLWSQNNRGLLSGSQIDNNKSFFEKIS